MTFYCLLPHPSLSSAHNQLSRILVGDPSNLLLRIPHSVNHLCNVLWVRLPSRHSNLANHLIIDTLWLWKLNITTWPLLSWGYQGAKFCNRLSSLSTEESLECNSDTIIQSQVKFRRIRTQFLTRLPSSQVPAASAGVPRPLTLLKS